jgi:hypothetical protein
MYDVTLLSEARDLHHLRARTANEWSSMQASLSILIRCLLSPVALWLDSNDQVHLLCYIRDAGLFILVLSIFATIYHGHLSASQSEL